MIRLGEWHTHQKIARRCGWLLVVAIVVLTLLPGDVRFHTGIPIELEHFAAYVTAVVVLSVGYEARWKPLAVAISLALLASVLELGQLLSPGRNAAVLDALIGAAGALLGCVVAWLVLRVLKPN